jgi:hypothetical protein
MLWHAGASPDFCALPDSALLAFAVCCRLSHMAESASPAAAAAGCKGVVQCAVGTAARSFMSDVMQQLE